MATQGVEAMLALRRQLQEKKSALLRQVDDEQRRVARLAKSLFLLFFHIICRLEQDNAQVQATLSAAKVENGKAKDQLAAVKAKLKAKEETVARVQDEEMIARNRINLAKVEARKEGDRRLKNVAMYQKEVMQLCDQMRKSNISGGNLEALEEKKARLLKELELIEGELKGFEEEGLQSPMVLEDWEGLVNILEFVKNKFKAAEEEMKKRASSAAKQRLNNQLAFSQPVCSKQN